ncbi:hypothetical protein CALVIDRAFT_602581 [Calocera viscosa TUFC12733]|uniref:Dienelactone hydrolase domain-containing protein n=1 Tax=Calocera viscosa (strain TUFC12733) TaxID=1330018 RepID=A0A167GW03_CALVF|nr:hypothetical protein CALVIDRAFT_602581 [Calocera viscosa TUFC12733]
MSTATGSSACCVTGHLHEGTPTGVVEKIIDLDVYVARPKDCSKAKTILLISDNARLLAVEYATAGFYVYVPDFFKVDNISHDMLQNIAPREPQNRSTLQVAEDNAKTMATFGPWVTGQLESVIKTLDGRYALVLAGEGSVDAAVSNHPSMASEADFLGITKPTQINVSTNDIFLPNETVDQVKAALAEKKADLSFEINEKENKEASANATLRWFNKYLA